MKLAAALPSLLLVTSLSAADDTGETLARWVALDAPIGHEHMATERLAGSLSGWSVDPSGNLVKSVGSGAPRRVVACGLDAHAYVVSQLRDDGYLRLHRIGGGSAHALWDQAHEGQQVRVLTSDGPRVGVVGIANGHFASQHRGDTAVATADDLWLDVGAESAADVSAMGIRLLDPVVRHVPPWSYAREVAGPGAGARVGCAAVAAAAEGEVPAGETVFVLSAQHHFGWVGLGGAVTRLGDVDEVIVVGDGERGRRDERLETDFHRRLGPVLERAGVESVRWLAPAVQDAGSLVERVTLDEAEALATAVRESAGVTGLAEWVDAPGPRAVVTSASEDDAERRAAELLTRLAETSAAPS